MLDNPTSHQNRLQANPHLADKIITGNGPKPPEGGEGACPAFGYLRGLHERANAIEFRFKNGNSVWFPYTWLGTWKFDPSAGLLLKFSGDLIYLVLIQGSNLDQPLQDSGIDLIRAGLQRHRILWIHELDDAEIQQTDDKEPTIDRVEIKEFESQNDLRNWLTQNAPAFLG